LIAAGEYQFNQLTAMNSFDNPRPFRSRFLLALLEWFKCPSESWQERWGAWKAQKECARQLAALGKAEGDQVLR
jgi:hypothetical protein